MKFTEGNVLKVEHNVIQDALMGWEAPAEEAEEKQMAHVLAYIKGVNDMAQAVIESMEAIRKL